MFDFATTTYTVAVANSVPSVTVTPTATHSRATIAVNGDRVDRGNASDPIPLMPGMPLDIPIVVFAETDPTIIMMTYTVTATRAVPPTISIAAGTSPVTEGAAATFTLTANPVPESNLTVMVTVDDGTGDFISGAAPTTVTINAATTTATLTVPTTNDTTAEAAGTITATVTPGTGYTVDGTDSASVTVQDNDGTDICLRTAAVRDAILATLTPSPACTSVTVGELATITTLDLRSMGITALASGDFAGLSALVTLNLFDNNLDDTLPSNVFAGLTSVQSLFINMNAFTSLPVGIFDELDALVNLALHTNPSFTPGHRSARRHL